MDWSSNMTRQSTQRGAPGSLAQGGALLPDFAAAWRRYLETCPESSRRRLDADGDRAFWSSYAARYDDDRQAGAVATLSLLQGFVRPEDTLLDVGAGTGRFTLPLAQGAGRVTALASTRAGRSSPTWTPPPSPPSSKRPSAAGATSLVTPSAPADSYLTTVSLWAS